MIKHFLNKSALECICLFFCNQKIVQLDGLMCHTVSPLYPCGPGIPVSPWKTEKHNEHWWTSDYLL